MSRSGALDLASGVGGKITKDEVKSAVDEYEKYHGYYGGKEEARKSNYTDMSTPWKGRLRSHHATPLRSRSPRLPCRAKKNQDEDEEAQTLKKKKTTKKAVPDNLERHRNRDKGQGAVRQPRVPARRSPRLAGKEHKECEVSGKLSTITPLRRSPRFHPDYRSSSKPLAQKESCEKQPSLPSNSQEISHSKKTQNIVSKEKKGKNLLRRSQRNATIKASARIESHKEAQLLVEDSEDIPPKSKLADVSCKKGEMKEPKHNNCEELTRKRKRGTKGKPSSKKQNHQEPKSFPPDCQGIAPSIEPRSPICKKSEKGLSSIMQPEIGDARLMNAEENIEGLGGIKGGLLQQLSGSDDWTQEQDIALRQAYFTARPSPHFWKEVSKMVPGKSAEECFNRVHADLSTPTPIAPRPRASKTKFSPLGHFTLSDTKFPNLLEPAGGRPRTSKQKSLAAQKTVRHLLKKHCLIDQAQEADHFSIFETSPSALQLNISFEDSPGTPDSCLNPCSLQKFSGCSSARKKPLSRFKTTQTEPSPAVLKPVKNVILHEKFIDQLSRREATKRPRKKAANTKFTDSTRNLSGLQNGGLKAAKNALISEATDFISHFKKLQANSLANVVENSEDDECGSSDSCPDNVKQ